MSLNPLNGSNGVRTPSETLTTSNVQRAQTPAGIGNVRETVSAVATSGSPFDSVSAFFQSICNGVTSFFTSIGNFFTDCFKGGKTSGSGSNASSGAVVTLGDVPAHVFQGLSINQRKINERPEPLDPELIRHVAENSTPPVQIRQLLTEFDRVCNEIGVTNNQVLYQDQGRPITRRGAREALERNYIGFVEQNMNRARAGGQDYHPLAAADIDVFLKGIIIELRKPEVSIEKKRVAIENLASAAEHCPPRRHTEAMKVYRVLSNQMETIDEILKQYIQATKEDLFVNYYSLARESVMTLNYIRRTVGQQLGLDINPVNLQDIYISMHDARSPENRNARHETAAQFTGVFNRLYTPQNVLFNMKNFLNERIANDADFARAVSQFIDNELTAHENAGRLTAADTANLPMPYQYDIGHRDADGNINAYQLTDEGVRFLLVHFEHLNSTTPNAHLVRAQAATV